MEWVRTVRNSGDGWRVMAMGSGNFPCLSQFKFELDTFLYIPGGSRLSTRAVVAQTLCDEGSQQHAVCK